jgi:hypothetical protein
MCDEPRRSSGYKAWDRARANIVASTKAAPAANGSLLRALRYPHARRNPKDPFEGRPSMASANSACASADGGGEYPGGCGKISGATSPRASVPLDEPSVHDDVRIDRPSAQREIYRRLVGGRLERGQCLPVRRTVDVRPDPYDHESTLAVTHVTKVHIDVVCHRMAHLA